MAKSKPSSSISSAAVFAIALIVLLFAGILSFFLSKNLPKSSTKPVIPPTVTPTPRPLPQGKQVYNVSTASDAKGPRITQVIVDPFDPKIGEMQTIAVKVTDSQGVESVTILFKTDKKVTTYKLSLKEGTAVEGTWEGSWKTEDTHNYIYMPIVQTVGKSGTSKIELAFR